MKRREWLWVVVALLCGWGNTYAATCDIDEDGDIDRSDIELISALRNQDVAAGDDRDTDGDGRVTVNDMRQCVVRCTLPRCEEPDTGATLIDSAGGVFEFSGDLKLEVPAGALTEPTLVKLTPSDCGAIQPILAPREISTKPDKSCLAAFSGTPSGLEFELPVRVTVPIPGLASGHYPILVDVNQETATYSLLPTTIEYDAAAGTARAELNGFSEKAFTDVELDPEEEFGPEWAAAGEEIENRCGSCNGQLGNAGANLPFCENLDLFQDSCCLIPPAARGACFSDCFCCKEQRAIVKVSEVDFSSGDCQVLGSDIEVTYPDCPGAPTYTDSIDETSAECPPLQWEISVDPPSADVLACQEPVFTATIRGLDPTDGSEVLAPSTLFPTWVSTDDTVARFIGGDGRLRALTEGNTVVEARISGRNPAKGAAPVTVRSNIE
ncbi:MAG: hypothetical protein P8172_04600 [Gammaproteobacteria bacterium]